VIIVGGGFGGLQCAKALRGKPVDVLLVDRRNYHLFTPLLYQVASCLLNPSEITAPLRRVFRNAPNVRYREGDVTGVDYERKVVHLTQPRNIMQTWTFFGRVLPERIPLKIAEPLSGSSIVEALGLAGIQVV